MKARKVTAAVLATALVLGPASSSLANTTEEANSDSSRPAAAVQLLLEKLGFRDVSAAHWAADSILSVVEEGLMALDGASKFDPEGRVTIRSGIATFARGLGIAGVHDTNDIAVKKARHAGLVPDDVNLDSTMTRVDAAWVIAGALCVEPKAYVNPATYPFNDFAITSAEDRAILAALYEIGIIEGYEDRTFRPDKPITRAEIATLIDRVLSVQE